MVPNMRRTAGLARSQGLDTFRDQFLGRALQANAVTANLPRCLAHVGAVAKDLSHQRPDSRSCLTLVDIALGSGWGLQPIPSRNNVALFAQVRTRDESNAQIH
jgi:hypothetical protein